MPTKKTATVPSAKNKALAKKLIKKDKKFIKDKKWLKGTTRKHLLGGVAADMREQKELKGVMTKHIKTLEAQLKKLKAKSKKKK